MHPRTDLSLQQLPCLKCNVNISNINSKSLRIKLHLTPHQRSFRSVMFSVLSVCHYICSQSSGPHVAATHDAIGQSQVTFDPSPHHMGIPIPHYAGTLRHVVHFHLTIQGVPSCLSVIIPVHRVVVPMWPLPMMPLVSHRLHLTPSPHHMGIPIPHYAGTLRHVVHFHLTIQGVP